MEPSKKSNKGVYVIEFGKEKDQNKELEVGNKNAVILPDELPRIDVQIKGGDQLTATTKNGKVVEVTRNGVKIESYYISGKKSEIEKEEKKKDRDSR